MADAHKNFAISTVATAPSPASSGTSLVVASGDGAKFPAVPFNATVWPVGAQPTTVNAEIVRVTAISTDTLTITRAQESSVARTVIVGDQIAATVTAKTLTDVELAFATPAVVLGSAAAAGSAATIIRSDSTIAAFDTTVPVTQAHGDQSAVGTAAFAARRDHVHGMPADFTTRVTGTLAETGSRNWTQQNTALLSSGRLSVVAIQLAKNQTITSISWMSGTQALVTGSNQWFALFDSTRNQLRVTGDDTSTAWAANSIKTLNLSSTYLTTTAGLFYIGLLVVATTVPSLLTFPLGSGTGIHTLLPVTVASCDTGLTNPASCPATFSNFPTSSSALPYGYVS